MPAVDATHASIADELAATLTLEARVVELVRRLKRLGAAAWCRPASYRLAPTRQGATFLTAEIDLVAARGAFVAFSLAHPIPGGATEVRIQRFGSASKNIVDNDVLLAQHICDDETDDDEARPLPWPVVWEPGGKIKLECSASANLDTTTGVAVRGFHVDATTAALLRLRELGALSLERSKAAATVMQSEEPFVVQLPLNVTHLLAREALTGDAALSSFSLRIKGEDTFNGGAIVPPSTPAKPGAAFDVPLSIDDTIMPRWSWTSAGGAGTGAAMLTFIGSRTY